GTLQERVSKLKSKVESLRQENTRLRERIDDLRRNMTPRNSSNASARNATQPKSGFGFGVILVSIVTVSALALLRRKKGAE
ncbi:MAG: hypothetical protein SV760_08890, partial [Halobacteria archaeon]|nr:hypothetical protein [Halobacteria archaeon]